jgi:simple sugar transport system permease protein
MRRLLIEPRFEVPGWLTLLATIVAVLFALLLGAIPLALFGLNPLVAYRQMFTIAFTDSYSISDTLVKATPLILAGLGVAVAFRMKLWNIGAEGQLIIGAWAASGVALFLLPPETPRILMLLAMGVAGFVAGGLWGAIPGVLRARRDVNEIITSLMLTYIAILFASYFIYGPWAAGGFGLTRRFPETAWFPRLLDYADAVPLFRGMTAHGGFLVGLAAAIILYVLFKRGKWGYELKLIGDNPNAANYAGISIARHIVLTFIISGGLAGLAGMSEVAGVVHRLQENFSPGYGFTAIIVAWLARLNPLGILLVGYLFGGLLVGGDAIQPAGVSLMIQGLVMFCVISADLLTRYRIRFVRPEPSTPGGAEVEPVTGD